MKMYVFADAVGRVIGSFTPRQNPDPKAPTFHPAQSAESDYRVHEIDAPDHFRSIASAADLHVELAKLIGTERST